MWNETNLPKETLPVQQGWQCPKCGNVYAPFMQQCLKCNKADMKGKAG